MKISKIDHIGIAVKDLKMVGRLYSDAFGLEVSDEIDVPERKLRIAFIEISGTKLEFLMPTDKESVVAKFIDKRGEGIHHVCFEVDDIEKAVSDLKSKGVGLVDEKPRLGVEGDKIVFLQPKSAFGVLIELKEKRALRN
ncbi:MAG: methylmalonyl-CoA epimerase [candidate division Zixibacteria bacterium]|nr:methylmalonyl-CoA epimerase [candidate division Zixibacteria bacterium]